jgi:glycerophosphoryl diester phosphodiesterase
VDCGKGEVEMNDMKKGIMICAHRGFTKSAPENSLKAIQDAIEAGFKAVEIDVRHTRDDVLVLMHDSTVDRTTDGHGRVDGFSRNELAQLKLLWRNKPFARIPSLNEVFESANGRIILYIDMKTERIDLILALVQKYRAYSWTILLGEVPKIAKAHRLDPKVNVHTVANSKPQLDSLLQVVRPAMIEVSRLPDPEYLAYAHANGLPVELDAMGKPDFLAIRLGIKRLWRRYLGSDVDFIMSDFPQELRSFMHKMGIAERQALL